MALADREVEVGVLLAKGATYQRIAELLDVDQSTVRSQAVALRSKLKAGATLPRGCAGPDCARHVAGRHVYCTRQCRNRAARVRGGHPVAPLERLTREQPAAPKPPKPPSQRQLEVAQIIYVQGFTTVRAGRVLGLSANTVSQHLIRLRSKLGLRGVRPVAMRYELERRGFLVDIYSALDDRRLGPATSLYLASFDLLLALPEGDADAPAARRLMGLAYRRARLPSVDAPAPGPRVTPDLTPVLKHLDL